MSSRAVQRAPALTLALALLLACTTDDIVLYEAPGTSGAAGSSGAGSGGASATAGNGGADPALGGAPGTSGATSGTGGTGGTAAGSSGQGTCATEFDCAASEFCEKTSCDAPTGNCSPRPSTCAPERQVVCGCDRITYYNDCLRRRYAVPASTPGECRMNGRRCRSAEDCGASGASCGFLYPPDPAICSAMPDGICWRLDATCDEMNPLPWIPCPDVLPAPLTCIGMCDAIRSGMPHIPPPPGMCR